MLKNLASLGAASAVKGSRALVLEARPRSALFGSRSRHFVSNTSPQLSISTAKGSNQDVRSNISGRRHAVGPSAGPSVGIYDADEKIRKLHFTGECPRLTVAPNRSNPNIARSGGLEWKTTRPSSRPRTSPQKPSLPRNFIAPETQHPKHRLAQREKKDARNETALSTIDLGPIAQRGVFQHTPRGYPDVSQENTPGKPATPEETSSSSAREFAKPPNRRTMSARNSLAFSKRLEKVKEEEDENASERSSGTSRILREESQAKKNRRAIFNLHNYLRNIEKFESVSAENDSLFADSAASHHDVSDCNMNETYHPHSVSTSYKTETKQKSSPTSIQRISKPPSQQWPEDEENDATAKPFIKRNSYKLLESSHLGNSYLREDSGRNNQSDDFSKPNNSESLYRSLHKKDESLFSAFKNKNQLQEESKSTLKEDFVSEYDSNSGARNSESGSGRKTIRNSAASKPPNRSNNDTKSMMERFGSRSTTGSRTEAPPLSSPSNRPPVAPTSLSPSSSVIEQLSKNRMRRTMSSQTAPTPPMLRNQGAYFAEQELEKAAVGTKKVIPFEGLASFKRSEIAQATEKEKSTPLGLAARMPRTPETAALRGHAWRAVSQKSGTSRAGPASAGFADKASGRGGGGGGGKGGGGKGGGGKGGAKQPPSRTQDKFETSVRSPESFLSGTGAVILESLYLRWLDDPQSVHKSWHEYFQSMTEGTLPAKILSGTGMSRGYGPVVPAGKDKQQPAAGGGAGGGGKEGPSQPKGGAGPLPEGQLLQQLTLQNIMHYYHSYGHLHADVDPLQQRGPALHTKYVSAADMQWPAAVQSMLEGAGLSDMKAAFAVPLGAAIAKEGEASLPLEEILGRLHKAYCGYAGVEFMHIASEEQRKWIQQQFEPGMTPLSPEQKKKLWRWLLHSANFETFLTRKWPTTFRFSLEGGEILIPALQLIVEKCVENGCTSVVIGMAHRGRLNVTANLLNKDIDKLMGTFSKDANFGRLAGDVKYHLGCYVTQKYEGTDKDITICILSNASHLESVNAMLQGRCKAEQIIQNDKDGKKVLPIVIHGDAAYAGQGCVYEHCTLSRISSYDVHGSLHIVINNNIGFTTVPEESRSALYCTDVAKILQAPVFHVNGERPDEVMHCVRVACDFRNKFKSDAVVDIVCYRRYGHNEADDPSYTSPALYAIIKKRTPWPQTFTQQLLQEKVISQEEMEQENNAYFTKCEEAFKKSQSYTSIDWKDWNDSPWKDFATSESKEIPKTGISEDMIIDIGKKSLSVPEGFEIHKLLIRMQKARTKMMDSRIADWPLGETLAIGSLLMEGVPIRFTGQDAQRGTFSHRHHVLHDQKSEVTHIPLNHLKDEQAKYEIVNTPLIEYGALAFEMGYAMSFANSLVLYEGQYGDFINNAQLVFDAYLSSGENKWGRQCGLVILAPHGMEGMGSEHSSARLERFLQLSAVESETPLDINDSDYSFKQLQNTNWIVGNCTTPANFFHILRRQMKLPFRKPLIMMTPKSLLRHPECRSSFDDFKEGTSFKAVISDTINPEGVKKHLLCSGRVYYDLIAERKEKNLESVIAITRVEQLAPIPNDLILKEMKKYDKAEICWVQEEHKNQGPWNYIFEHLNALILKTHWYTISYVGRAASSVTAVGTASKHNQEKTEFLEKAMTVFDTPEERGIKTDKMCLGNVATKVEKDEKKETKKIEKDENKEEKKKTENNENKETKKKEKEGSDPCVG